MTEHKKTYEDNNVQRGQGIFFLSLSPLYFLFLFTVRAILRSSVIYLSFEKKISIIKIQDQSSSLQRPIRHQKINHHSRETSPKIPPKPCTIPLLQLGLVARLQFPPDWAAEGFNSISCRQNRRTCGIKKLIDFVNTYYSGAVPVIEEVGCAATSYDSADGSAHKMRSY